MRTAATIPAGARADFRRSLLSWHRRNARRLPWREPRSLYRTVVSEFMLQQTQVATVVPYFERWLEAFPDFAALAAAPAELVLKHWEGLGYYSRARNLHRLAQALAQGPGIPATAEAWAELPGVGPYTAAAITSIAFGHPAACVDGNVVRILARLTGDDRPYRTSVEAARALAPLAEELLSPEFPGEHNEAMMELGATVCTRRRPQCLLCPVAEHCAARGRDPERFPRLAAKMIERQTIVRLWCERTGALLLHRAPAGSRRLAEIHELPSAEQAGLTPARAQRGALLAARSRSITRFRLAEPIHRLTPATLAPAVRTAPDNALLDGRLVWVPLGQLERVTVSGPHRRWIREILAMAAPGSAVRPAAPATG